MQRLYINPDYASLLNGAGLDNYEDLYTSDLAGEIVSSCTNRTTRRVEIAGRGFVRVVALDATEPGSASLGLSRSEGRAFGVLGKLGLTSSTGAPEIQMRGSLRSSTCEGLTLDVQPDFRDLLALFDAHRVEYVVVGAYALAFHGAPRFTGDMDILVRPGIRNARRIIAALAEFNVRGEIRDGRVGVWVERPEKPPLPDGTPREDKIAAIGIRLRKWISFHGISINVDPDLDHFSGIVPCGITEHGVTSLVDLGLPVTLEDVDVALKRTFATVF